MIKMNQKWKETAIRLIVAHLGIRMISQELGFFSASSNTECGFLCWGSSDTLGMIMAVDLCSEYGVIQVGSVFILSFDSVLIMKLLFSVYAE